MGENSDVFSSQIYRDAQGSDSSIPLSSDWLLPKPRDDDKTRTISGESHASPFPTFANRQGTVKSQGNKKLVRRTDNSSGRLADSGNKDASHDSRGGEGRWNPRWGPDGKGPLDKWTHSGKDEWYADHPQAWGSRSALSRGKTNPLYHSRTSNKQPPMVVYGRGRGENYNPTCSIGRRKGGFEGYHMRNITNLGSHSLFSEKIDRYDEESSFLKYGSRSKMLDVNRVTDMKSNERMLDGVMMVTQEEPLEPNALIAPTAAEELFVFDKGDILSSGAPQITKDDGPAGRKMQSRKNISETDFGASYARMESTRVHGTPGTVWRSSSFGEPPSGFSAVKQAKRRPEHASPRPTKDRDKVTQTQTKPHLPTYSVKKPLTAASPRPTKYWDKVKQTQTKPHLHLFSGNKPPLTVSRNPSTAQKQPRISSPIKSTESSSSIKDPIFVAYQMNIGQEKGIKEQAREGGMVQVSVGDFTLEPPYEEEVDLTVSRNPSTAQKQSRIPSPLKSTESSSSIKDPIFVAYQENNESSIMKSGGDFTVEPPYEEMFEGCQSPPMSIQVQRVRDQLQEFLLRDPCPFPSTSHVPDESEQEAPDIMEQEQQYPIPPERGMGEVRCRPTPTHEDCIRFLYSASRDELLSIKGIKEARANFIIKLREESPEAFKSLDDFGEHIIGGKASRKDVRMMMNAITKKLKDGNG